ncbi:hypothetical protein GQ53DRAFT_840935 [Thozetella sp. PMI_491]|nr:hypothetical protein GQ53DRAFT_840935 [Thozetella sp. PMI_491]
MATQRQRQVDVVAGFIDIEAPSFHSSFGVPSQLNRSTMEYEREDVLELKETLECSQRKARSLVDFIPDLNQCTWETVHQELHKAQVAAADNEKRGKTNPVKRVWRKIGVTSTLLEPGLAAIPDNLSVLNGGLAVVFALARHSEMNRLKILSALETVPNIIEIARNKAKTFPLDCTNLRSIQLHQAIRDLQDTLLQTLPALINRLVPGTFLKSCKSVFGEWKIDKLLDAVSVSAEAVRMRSEALVEELIVGNYTASITIQAQLDQMIQNQRLMQMSIEAAHGKTHLLHFLMEQLNFNTAGIIAGRDQAEMSEMGTALPGYTPEDLLKRIDVNPLWINKDEGTVIRRGDGLPPGDIDRAKYMMGASQIQGLLARGSGPGIVAVDGHFDRTQTGKVSALSYVCAMLSQALGRVLSQQQPSSPGVASPTSSQPPHAGFQGVILRYFCALHTADDDDLKGPQGLMRGLTTQLIMSLVANKWIRESDPVDLPHLRDGEEELLEQQNLGAICRLFVALVRLVPDHVPIYCLVDSWSAYERDELWQTDYDEVLVAFREAADAYGPDRGPVFKLLLTSPTSCRWLGDFLPPKQRVSLRNGDAGDRKWRGAGRGGLMNLARAATMPDVHNGIGGGSSLTEEQVAQVEGHYRRSST